MYYLGDYSPTDVISFDISPLKKDRLLADIVVSTDMAVRNSKVYKTSPEYELHLYISHGILHLLGYNDDTVLHRSLMDRKAKEILSGIKLED